MPTFHDKDIPISIDLIDAARKQLDFLRDVDRHFCLYSGPVAANAIRRYEHFWLPLAADAKNSKPLAAPLDIHWIWHCHMLAPYYYEKDCNSLVGAVVEHKLLSENDRRAGTERARKLWEERYPHEPFEVNLDTNIACSNSEAVNCNGVVSSTSRISYDLSAAVSRQKVFFYQVSLPHYRDLTFLKSAVARYKKFLFLKRNNPNLFLVPCYDFDLVWHSHMVHPSLYKKDTTSILGRMFNHDDSVNDRAPESKLNRSDIATRQLWKTSFGEEFALCGCMYRGDPPQGKLQRVTKEQVYAMASKLAEVVINSLRVDGLEPDQKFCLKVALNGSGSGEVPLLKLKGPDRIWENGGTKGIAKFSFDTGQHSNIQFDLVDKKGFLCLASNQSFAHNNLPFLTVVENTEWSGQAITSTVPLIKSLSDIQSGASVTINAAVQPPKRGPCVFVLQAGTFQACTMPENIEQMWGPIPLPRLPAGTPNTCIVASHR